MLHILEPITLMKAYCVAQERFSLTGLFCVPMCTLTESLDHLYAGKRKLMPNTISSTSLASFSPLGDSVF